MGGTLPSTPSTPDTDNTQGTAATKTAVGHSRSITRLVTDSQDIHMVHDVFRLVKEDGIS